MSKQKMAAGAMLDVASTDELIDVKNSILAALGKNATFKRVVAQANVALTSGNINIPVECPDGFIWTVMLVVVDAGSATATWQAYMNTIGALNAVCNLQTGSGVLPLTKNQVVLKGNDTLIIASGTVAPPANYQAGVTLHVIEVPYAHEAQLLL